MIFSLINKICSFFIKARQSKEDDDDDDDIAIGIHVDKEYHEEYQTIEKIKIESKKNELDENQKKQIKFHLQRIYATVVFKKLLKHFDKEITAYPSSKIKLEVKGRDIQGGIMNESLWWIPTVQGKYVNQRFVSYKLWQKLNFWHLNDSDNSRYLKNKDNLRMEHVVDKKSIKKYIIDDLNNNCQNHSQIIDKLKKYLFGCIILKKEHSLLPPFGEIKKDFFDEEDVFRKYIGEVVSVNLDNLKELEDGDYLLVKRDTLQKNNALNEDGNIGKIKIFPDDMKKRLTKNRLDELINRSKNKEEIIRAGEKKSSNGKVLKMLKFRFFRKEPGGIKEEENWLVPVFDRQEGYCLHDKDHPYNPFSKDPFKIERHKKFIDSIFAFDASFKSDLTNLLDELPKVDNQFPYK